MISCDQHDYVEIACTFRYPLKLTMKQGNIIEGIALDTKLNERKVECIKIGVEESERLVVLAEVSILEVCVDNPHFRIVCFD